MGNNSVPKFIFRLSRFPVYRGSVLGRFYCTKMYGLMNIKYPEVLDAAERNLVGPLFCAPLVYYILILMILDWAKRKDSDPKIISGMKFKFLISVPQMFKLL